MASFCQTVNALNHQQQNYDSITPYIFHFWFTVGHWQRCVQSTVRLLIVNSIRCWLCELSIDNSAATTKASKLLHNTASLWKAPVLISLIWMFRIFRNAPCPPPQTQTGNSWLQGRPQRMWPVFLFWRPQTQKCLQTAAVLWERPARREEEREN